MDQPISRRQAVNLVGVGLASVAAGSRAQTNEETPARRLQPTREDPRAKYPKPPFEEQTQPWPGLA